MIAGMDMKFPFWWYWRYSKWMAFDYSCKKLKFGLNYATRSVILCGIETHACIHHTAIDLIEMGIEVLAIHFVLTSCSVLGSHSCRLCFFAFSNRQENWTAETETGLFAKALHDIWLRCRSERS